MMDNLGDKSCLIHWSDFWGALVHESSTGGLARCSRLSAIHLDLIGLEFAQMNHSIEYTTSDARFDLLPFPTSRLELRTQDDLEAEDAGFCQRSSMISTVSFPSFPSLPSNRLHALVAGFDMPVASFRLPELRIVTRRNHRLNGGVLLRWIGQQIMDLPPIIGPIAENQPISPGVCTSIGLTCNASSVAALVKV